MEEGGGTAKTEIDNVLPTIMYPLQNNTYYQFYNYDYNLDTNLRIWPEFSASIND